MGIMKIGKKYRRMMKQTKGQLPDLSGRIKPQELYDKLESWYKRNGIKFKTKPEIDSWPFNLTTAYRGRIRFQAGWKDFPIESKAAMLVHERMHYMQRSRIKAFNAKYVTDPRFLIAVETQAYREELRGWRSMGASDEFLERFVKELPGRLKKNYITVPMLDYREVKKHVRKVLNDELENPT